MAKVVAAGAQWWLPAWQGRWQLGGSAILAVAAARLEMRRQRGGGGGNNGALAAAAWRMLIIILIVTMTMIIDRGEGKGGERAGCMRCWQSLRWMVMTIAMVIN